MARNPAANNGVHESCHTSHCSNFLTICHTPGHATKGVIQPPLSVQQTVGTTPCTQCATSRFATCKNICKILTNVFCIRLVNLGGLLKKQNSSCLLDRSANIPHMGETRNVVEERHTPHSNHGRQLCPPGPICWTKWQTQQGF